MTPQTVTIEVDPQTAATLRQLQAQAAAQGVPVATLLQSLVANGTAQATESANEAKEERPFYETATPEEWVREFLDWANNRDHNTPGLTLEDVSRDSIYED